MGETETTHCSFNWTKSGTYHAFDCVTFMLMFTCRVCLSLQAMVQQDKSGYSVTLHSASVAPFVWLDMGNIPGRFSSNGFLMLTRNRTVSFTAWRNTSVAELSRSLTITSLRDVY